MQHNCSYDELVDIHKLVPHPQNPNKHPDNQIERLAKIIDYQGQRSPVVVCKETGFIVVGHGRTEAMKKLGWDKVAVNYQTFKDEAQRYAHMTADNAIAEWAALDLAQINADMLDLGPELDLELLGIEDFVLEPIEKLDPGLVDEDDVPEISEPITKRGDVWLLGEHRVMCGDSTMIDDVEKLMAGEKADMVFTDPPYGVNYDGGALSKREKLKNDHISTSIYSDIMPILTEFTINKCGFYIWHAAGYADMAQDLINNNFSIRSQIVWNKNQAQFGALSAQYKQKHEPCFYCFKKGNSPNWYGPTNEVTVWDIDRENKNEYHPTQKPVKLSERAINNSSKIKDMVLDIFLGSGSTLIACEKTNRKCFGMELDEHYCDVIVNRWQNYTGKKAVLESNGKTYDELKDSNVG